MALLQMNLFSKTLRRNMPVVALIPTDTCSVSGSYVSPNGPLKTLYLLCNLEGNQLDWLLYCGIVELSRKYNLAIICPSGESKFYVNNSSTGEDFGYYVAIELVEQTRRIFNLSRRREDTFIGGAGMGGYGALRNGMKYSDNFGYIAALNPTIIDADYEAWVADRIAEGSIFGNSPQLMRAIFGSKETMLQNDTDLKALVVKQLEAGRTLPMIYMTCGSDESFSKADVDAYAEVLRENNVNFVYEDASNVDFVTHCRTYLPRAIRFFFRINPSPIH